MSPPQPDTRRGQATTRAPKTHGKRQTLPQRSWRGWIGAVSVALFIHLAVWWVPVSLPAMQLERPRTVRISIMKPPPRRPKVKPPKRRVTKPQPRRKIRRKRRRYKRRRYRRKRRIRRKRKPRKRVVKRQPPPKKPRRVAARKTIKPQPVQPAPRPPLRRVAPAPPPRRTQRQPAPRVNMRGYGIGVYRSIQRHKRYPLMAYKMRFEGRVILSIRIAKTGKLLGKPRVVRSSGHSLLDQEAIRMVLAAAPMRPMPRGYHRPYATFRIPINFRIRR